MKKILLILGLIAFISFGAQEVQAEAAQPTGNQEKIIYDLEQGGTQSFTVVTSAGEEIVIEVEEIPSMLRAVKNGNYKISAATLGQWKAEYQISISGNKITKAYSPSIVAYTGSFTSAKLTVDNTKQATYYLKRKVSLITTSINLRAKLLTNSISISY
ncbi:DUF5626 family protein [Carnobacterium mobile]|uniref:DUF5626 family protein n=1 Tax=Carnobacterium mobile TaxID=2750 RepID=UPI0005592346|nr:DUF5626 family protein [Carnobacterium mobile]